jgi:gamma-glutamyltranspeptidase
MFCCFSFSSEFASKLRSLVTNVSHPQDYYGPKLELTQDKGTAHISIIDHNEVMVSLTL